MAIAAATQRDSLPAEARAAAAAFLALEPALTPQTDDVTIRPLLRRVAADVTLGAAAMLLAAVVGGSLPRGESNGSMQTAASNSSVDDEASAAERAKRDVDARRVAFICKLIFSLFFLYFILLYFILFHFISFHFISFCFISFYFISFYFISFYFISFHFISFYFISFHFMSFDFISFHFISFLSLLALFLNVLS